MTIFPYSDIFLDWSHAEEKDAEQEEKVSAVGPGVVLGTRKVLDNVCEKHAGEMLTLE